jgi:hypothetical protein
MVGIPSLLRTIFRFATFFTASCSAMSWRFGALTTDT